MCRALDGLLFTPAGWFAIDASNRKVPGVTPGTLDQALALVGRAPVATVVGQLRPGVAGVDVDAAAALGDSAAAALRDWCAARGLWHLLRPSGGGPGRWHVIVVPGVHAADLSHFVDRLRRELRLTGRQLDVRTQLRPLSAPHRRAATVPLPDGLDEALEALQGILEELPAPVGRRPRNPATADPVRKPGGPAQPLAPLPRPRRELPDPWAAYLVGGRRAAAAVDRDPATRSQIELEATFQLVLAGYSEPDAWAAITAAHRTAFPKARSRGRTWWWHTWNRCVVDADAWLRARRAAAPPPAAQLHATQRARAALDAVWRTWPTRTRHTDAEVYTTVLERMDRVGAPAVAIPQRDLVLDSAVASRTTVRAALARLQAAGLLQVLPTYVPGTTDTAHTLALPDRLTGSDSPREGLTVSLTDPSRCQPPQPPLPLPLRRALGLPASAVHRQLRAPAGTPPPTLDALAHAAGLLDPDQDTPTDRQLRTLRGHLRTLAHHGLAHVDEHGRWRASPPQDAAVPTAVERAGRAADAVVRDRVATERAQFRDRVDPDARRARWQRQRLAALQRAAKAKRSRQKAWWDALPPGVRDRRRTAAAAAFAALSPADQARRKHTLAEQRARAGEDEPARYAAWIERLSAAELEQRSLDRALTFAARPRHDQQQLAAAWDEHRARWRLPRRRPASRLTPPPTRAAPDEALLSRAVPGVEEIALFDAGTLSALTVRSTA